MATDINKHNGQASNRKADKDKNQSFDKSSEHLSSCL